MTKKGIVEEIFSKALFADEAKLYKIVYRDFDRLVETTMPELLKESENFQTIPINRIKKIMKNGTVLFEKNGEKE